jgi:hypothetical protein
MKIVNDFIMLHIFTEVKKKKTFILDMRFLNLL